MSVSMPGNSAKTCPFWDPNWKVGMVTLNCLDNNIFLEPFDDPCFDWSEKVFFWRVVEAPKDKRVPGYYKPPYMTAYFISYTP